MNSPLSASSGAPSPASPSATVAHVVGLALIQTKAALHLAVPQADSGRPLDLTATRALADAATAVRDALDAIKDATRARSLERH